MRIMDSPKREGTEYLPHRRSDGDRRINSLTSVNRRGWLKLAAGAGVGLTLDGLIDVNTVRAATQKIKLAR